MLFRSPDCRRSASVVGRRKKSSFGFDLRPGWKGILANGGSGLVLLMLLVQEEAFGVGRLVLEGRYRLVVGVEAAANHVSIRMDGTRHRAGQI